MYGQTRRLLGFEGERHVMDVLGMVRDKGSWALVMPLMGPDLRRRFKLDVCTVALCLARALRAVHAQGLIHGDVKDANIFITKGRIVLGDFGCCIEASQDPKPPLMGTAHYRDPAVRSGVYGPEVDVFSFGKVVDALLQRVTHRSAQLEELDKLAKECRTKERSSRPNAAQLVQRLKRITSVGGSPSLSVRQLSAEGSPRHCQIRRHAISAALTPSRVRYRTLVSTRNAAALTATLLYTCLHKAASIIHLALRWRTGTKVPGRPRNSPSGHSARSASSTGARVAACASIISRSLPSQQLAG